MRDKHFEDEFFWPLNPRALSESRNQAQLDTMKYLVEHREHAKVLMMVTDEQRSYEYDEYALVELDGDLYLLNTSGCSCPSPTETWYPVLEKTTLAAVRTYFTGGKYEGLTFPHQVMNDALKAIDELIRVEESSPDTTHSNFDGSEDQS